MTDDNREKWRQLPEITINNRKIAKHARKIEAATIKHAHKFLIKRWGNVVEVRRHVMIWILIMAVLVAATGLQLMWVRQNYTAQAVTNDGTYAEAVLGPLDTLNPIYAMSSAEKSASNLIFSKILKYDKTGNLNYDLASDVSNDKTGKVYTVKIRSDIFWHDGTKLDANDILFTINLLKNPDVRSTIKGWDDVKVKLIDNYSLQFSLKSTYAAFEHVLTFPVLPKHYFDKIEPAKLRENKFSQEPIGSGPFKYKYTQDIDVESGEKIIYLARNNGYYAGSAKLSTFYLHVYNSTEAILGAISKKAVNAGTDLSSVDVNRVDAKHYDLANVPLKGGLYAILNTNSSVLSDLNIRRALQVGTDTGAIIDELPSGTPALYLPFTNGQLSGKMPPAPKFNLSTAQKMLKNSGWVQNEKGVRVKKGKELQLNVVTMKGNEFERVLELLAGQWRALGVNVLTQVVDPEDISQSVAQSVLQPRNYDVLVYRLDIGADPDVFAYWHSSQISNTGLNFANYANDISDDALLSARTRLEPAIRNAKYIVFANRWLNDVPAIGLYQSTMQYVSSDNVRTFDTENKIAHPEDRYADILNWATGDKTVYKTP